MVVEQDTETTPRAIVLDQPITRASAAHSSAVTARSSHAHSSKSKDTSESSDDKYHKGEEENDDDDVNHGYSNSNPHDSNVVDTASSSDMLDPNTDEMKDITPANQTGGEPTILEKGDAAYCVEENDKGLLSSHERNEITKDFAPEKTNKDDVDVDVDMKQMLLTALEQNEGLADRVQNLEANLGETQLKLQQACHEIITLKQEHQSLVAVHHPSSVGRRSSGRQSHSSDRHHHRLSDLLGSGGTDRHPFHSSDDRSTSRLSYSSDRHPHPHHHHHHHHRHHPRRRRLGSLLLGSTGGGGEDLSEQLHSSCSTRDNDDNDNEQEQGNDDSGGRQRRDSHNHDQGCERRHSHRHNGSFSESRRRHHSGDEYGRHRRHHLNHESSGSCADRSKSGDSHHRRRETSSRAHHRRPFRHDSRHKD